MIDDLKAQVSNYLDENIGLDAYRLDVGIILDYLHAKGLLMVWNYDMSATPLNARILILRESGDVKSKVLREPLTSKYGWSGDKPVAFWVLPKGDA